MAFFESGAFVDEGSMRELIADLFISLDGFALGEGEGPYFGLGGPALDQWIKHEIQKPQVLLLGRKTYEVFADVSMTATDELSARMNELPKMVFSNSLQGPLAWRHASPIHGELAETITALKRLPGEPLRCIGSLTLLRGLIQAKLVDRLRLMVFPLVLGAKGKEALFEGYPRTEVELISATTLDSRIVLLEYRPR
jgi:dihydrofolate reductase